MTLMLVKVDVGVEDVLKVEVEIEVWVDVNEVNEVNEDESQDGV